MGVHGEDRSTVREVRGTDRPEPGILCWNCRRLTPFDHDRCQSCGAAFAGSTGGVYATSRLKDRLAPKPAPRPPIRTAADPSRSLTDLLADIQRVHDISSRRPSPALRESDDSVVLFQCPSCGRFVSEKATGCVCGVKFAAEIVTFSCPECDSHVPELEDQCPVCGVKFEESTVSLTYSCPRCGAQVAADAIRCSCGVWFED